MPKRDTEQGEDLAFADTAYAEATLTQVPYESIYETLGLSEGDTRPLPFNETIARDAAEVESMRDLLPRLSMGSEGARTSHFEWGEILGRGGMGVVHLARQRALGRDVAVKTISGKSQHAEDVLLQEARVMGMVEHPNIVPVHLIGKDDDGSPVVVMKRIEGKTWDEFLGADDLDDPLGFHLDIMVDVCRALELAHTRGILHRDLKPANVMVGEFGEVYVLDWGLAVSLPGQDIPGIPKSRDADQVVGTPSYIAPEMTIGRGDELAEQTDIYLLGAVLYEVLTGRPPHDGNSLFEFLRSSYEGKPLEFDDETPDELVAICRRATARAPEERYSSVAEFREAIQEFLGHRSSYDVTDEAEENLLKLKETLGADQVDEIEAYRAFGAARFGFEHALSIWRENRRAVDGLQETLATMIQHEIERENPRAARVLLVDLPRPSPELQAQLEQLEEELGERDEELQFLRNVVREYDTELGIEVKAKLIAVMGLGFVILGLVRVLFLPLEFALEHDMYLGLTLSFLPLMLGITFFGRETFRANVANRAMLVGLWVMYGAGLAIRFITYAWELDTGLSIAFELLLFATGTGLMALLLYRRMVYPAAAFALGALTAAVFPAWGFEIYGAAGAIACFSFAAAVRVADSPKLTHETAGTSVRDRPE